MEAHNLLNPFKLRLSLAPLTGKSRPPAARSGAPIMQSVKAGGRCGERADFN